MSLLYSLLVLSSTISFAYEANLHCDNGLFCGRTPHRTWLARRKVAQRLAELHELSQGEGFISKNSSIYPIYQQKDMMCNDELYAGFLLDDFSDQWNVSCIWAGVGIEIACAPVPPKYNRVAFAYIAPPEWQRRINAFRVKIGCSPERINQTSQIPELFICNERCIQGGIGFIPSLIMLLSFSAAFIKNCIV
ncbi:unnamed protein product [Cylicocyclus nassatus]|uniref:Uncharacterized protein n=1 Tax=Cylicocyclus nassatus TaxID=53992 RepID=A0AA36H6L1_CYLNA|nr:unnamed protein product [Cylicocyclus nassatus]